MNAVERRQHVKAILDTLRNAQGQLDTMKLTNGEPETAIKLRDTLRVSIEAACQDAERWNSYELDKLA